MASSRARPRFLMMAGFVPVWLCVVSIVSGAPVQRTAIPSALSATAWQPGDGATPPVTADKAIQFTLSFSRDMDRAYWDLPAAFNGTTCSSIEVDFSCDRPEAIRELGVYLRSGDGWYAASRPLWGDGRQRLSFSPSDFTSEGRPAGWAKISAIRLSPWRGYPADATFTLYGIYRRSDALALIRPTLSAFGDPATAVTMWRRVRRALDKCGIPHAQLTDEEVIQNGLRGFSTAILPFNPTPPSDEIKALNTFVRGRGRLMVFYGSDPRLAELAGLRLDPYVGVPETEAWTGIAFDQPGQLDVPAAVSTRTAHLIPVQPIRNDDFNVLARWEKNNGQPSPYVAWAETSRGLWMTHVLPNPTAAVSAMLRGLVCRMEPSLWQEALPFALQRAGCIAGAQTPEEAIEKLTALARQTPAESRAIAALADIARSLNDVRRDVQAGNFRPALRSIENMEQRLTEVYSWISRAPTHELRGVWESSGRGMANGDWSDACAAMARHGINAVFPCVLGPGFAHFPITDFPLSDMARQRGDQLQACLRAARPLGIKVHAWVICWNLEGAPANRIADLRKENRLQLNAAGEELRWLCPVRPENTRMMMGALVALAKRGVDGIHLDYIRYPGPDACYCDASRKAFEQHRGGAVKKWPEETAPGGALATEYRAFQQSQLNRFVHQASQAVRQINPAVEVSAAVFPAYPDCAQNLSQDWPVWVRQHSVDFVFPINYTVSSRAFAARARVQIAAAESGRAIAGGIGATADESQLTIGQILTQVDITRQMNLRGFVFFSFDLDFTRSILPSLPPAPTP